MPLEPGKDIAHYHVVAKLGEGGMGEVWRATDRKLGRDVALKLLPATCSGDPERMARFQREAQVLASLNHPNIAAIYGIEQVGGESFLVLELVEGPDLTEHLAHGPLPLEQALDVARQMADALETAHERGIVHRDLKPANVKRTPDGRVKILDFGLAKALQQGGGGEPDSSLSPTITSLSTRAGVILGTAAYMAPEQARGGEVDRRADVWAFGCVLLEMLTARNPFREPTVSDTLASILRSEPDLDALPEDTPAPVRRLLRRCLDKDPRRRLRDIGEARVAIEDVLAGDAEEPGESSTVTASPPARRQGIGWAGMLLAMALTAVVTAALFSVFREPTPRQHPRRFEAVTGAFVPSSVALSPDARKIVFIRDDHLWLRFLDRLEPVRLEQTQGATKVAWSPDSESILFVAHGDLLSIPIAGGAPRTVALGIGEVGAVGGVAVFGDRVIFASGDAGIRELSTRGGEPRDVVVPDGKTESDFHQPSFLPGGEILYVVHDVSDGPDAIAVYREGSAEIVLETPEQGIRSPVYSPTGHLVYRRHGAKAGLWAAPFSPERLQVVGEPFLITTNGVFPSVADDGTLLFVSNTGEGGVRTQLVWVRRDGAVGEPVGPEMEGIGAPAISPDGKRIAIMKPDTESGNIWLFDAEGGGRTRLTFGSRPDWDPVWSADGESVVFWEGTSRVLTRIFADGSGRAERLVKPDMLDSGNPSMSPDGKWMVFWARTGPLEQDLLVVDLEGDGTPVPIVDSPAIENYPAISPDGNYLAYTSNESGRFEVYLTRFPGGEGKWQVSIQGGSLPEWSPAGDELFYVAGTVLLAVPVTLGSVPRYGEPVPLFDAVDSHVNIGWNQRYAVSRDGKRFLMVKDRQSEDAQPGMVINYDWPAAAEAR
ncbi:MAG: protein kinase [Candidatus Eiseniibacteriota bacterium]